MSVRVLITTTGSTGHVLPLVPFARACRRAGHDVYVGAPRSRAATIERTGLPYWAFDDPSPDPWAPRLASLNDSTPDEANARVVGDIFARCQTRGALPGVLAIVEAWRPDVIVRESYEFAGYLTAERYAIPHVRVALGLQSTEDWIISVSAPAVDELRAELRLAPDPRGDQLRSAPCVTLVPEALEDPAPRGMNTHRFSEARARPAPMPNLWPSDRDPLVYLTFGSVASGLHYFPALYDAAIDALAESPVRVLVTLGDADPSTLGTLPANTRVERWIAQDDILPHAGAVIGHGGFGTTLGALRYGRPAVLLPLFAADQWHNARRVAELGAGINLHAEPRGRRRPLDLPPPNAIAALPHAVRNVLEDPIHRRAARRIAAVDALPPVDAAADVLQRLSDQRGVLPPGV